MIQVFTVAVLFLLVQSCLINKVKGADHCLDCICSVESSDGKSPGCGSLSHRTCEGMSGCVWDVNSCSCGSFQIKEPYFRDCSEKHYVPIKNWHGCATNDNCARICVDNYMKRYARHCTGKDYSQLTCSEIAGIHNGGPKGCDSSGTERYRQKVLTCYSSTSKNDL